MNGHIFGLEPVCALNMTLGGRLLLGETAAGIRLTGYIAEGTVEGPRLSGKLARGGEDWACIDRDGILVPEVKLLVETSEGLVQIAYQGVVDMGPEGFARMQRGERPGEVFHPRTAIRMTSAAPAHAWVNRSLFLGIGLLDYSKGGLIHYDIYEVTTPPAIA